MDEPDYIIETLATIHERIAELKEKAGEARDEADHARGVIGLEGAAHAAAAEAARLDAGAADLQKVGECIENGFPYWERAGFEEALDALGEPWRWDTISEVLPPSIVLGHDANVRIPLDAQRAYAQAIEPGLFDRFELCSLFETDGDEVARTTYYLFGARTLLRCRQRSSSSPSGSGHRRSPRANARRPRPSPPLERSATGSGRAGAPGM